MNVISLNDDLKKDLLKDWSKSNLPKSKLMQLENDLFDNDPQSWHAVRLENEFLAIFETRAVPKVGTTRYVKNMVIEFSPSIGELEEGANFEDAKETIKTTTNILSKIFDHLLEGLNGEPKSFKIYNNQQMVHMFFYHFAEYLSAHFSEQYDTNFYGQWIEIKQIA